MAKRPDYQLEDQIGFVLRRVTQRHLALFSAAIPQVTTTQWAVIARLSEIGPMSQNHLGREAAMDAATVKGVVDRLVREGSAITSNAPSASAAPFSTIAGQWPRPRSRCQTAISAAVFDEADKLGLRMVVAR